MANKILTMNDVENTLDIKGIDKYDWAKGVYVAASALRSALAMWQVGGAVMAVGAVIAPFAAFFAALCAIGFPAAKAKQAVKKKGAKHGYAIGVALGLFNHGKYFMSTFIDNTSGSPGIAPSYMTGIYITGYNTSLLLGFCAANQLSQEEKKRLGDRVIRVMMEDAKRKGYRLNFQNWTERDGIQHFARTFINRIMKDD